MILKGNKWKTFHMLSLLEARCMLRSAQNLTLHLLWECWEDIRVTKVWTIGELKRNWWGTFKEPKITCLCIKRTNNLKVVGYSNSDFAGCVDSRKSISGYVFMFYSGVLSWRSAKQTLIATSTIKVEFVSCFEATSHGVWMKSFISGFRIVDSIFWPLRIYCDNSVAVFMVKNNKSGSRSKHINIKYLAIWEHVKENKVVIEHISIELMIIDPLTKGMPPLRFKDHVVRMGLSSILWFSLYGQCYFDETLVCDIFSYLVHIT